MNPPISTVEPTILPSILEVLLALITELKAPSFKKANYHKTLSYRQLLFLLLQH